MSVAKLLRSLKMTAEAEEGAGRRFLAAHPQQSAVYDSWLGILRE